MKISRTLVNAVLARSVVTPGFSSSLSLRTLLSGKEISAALNEHSIAYGRPGWADDSVHEEFHDGGIWRGNYYTAAVIGFTGHWIIRKNQLCVLPDRGTIVAGWFAGERCRNVWLVAKTGELLLDHLNLRSNEMGPLLVAVKKLNSYNVR